MKKKMISSEAVLELAPYEKFQNMLTMPLRLARAIFRRRLGNLSLGAIKFREGGRSFLLGSPDNPGPRATVEVLDPDTLEPVAPGEVGELVITTLTKEAFPVIRYRTRDLTRIIEEPCPCGRTFKRMSRIMGRTDDMLIIKGVNVFPTQIESILFEIEGTEPHYRIVVERENHQDKATVLVEVIEAIFFDEMKKQRQLVDTIKKKLAAELGVTVDVKLVEEKTLERFEGKGQRVIDKREL